MDWIAWVSVVAALLATVALVLGLLNRRALARGHAGAGQEAGRGSGARAAQGSDAAHEAGDGEPAEAAELDAGHALVAFVANPTKPGVPELRDRAVQACAARYLPEPMWFDTTEEDPGVGQAREAVKKGAQVVVAVGGDGTVRAVAEGLTGTGTAMGIIPQGTGNLLARNLDLPIDDMDTLLRIALTGESRTIDVGWLTVIRDESQVRDDIAEADPAAASPEKKPSDGAGSQEPPRDHIFLVMAGLGFDADVMGDTNEDLKAKVGWLAYFMSAMRHLGGSRLRLDIRHDLGPWRSVRARSLVFGNVGKLPGGITLLPDAAMDDGWMDIGVIDARAGLAGWAQLLGEVTLQKFGVKTDNKNKVGHIEHSRARTVRVRSRDPQQVQVDGDTIGTVLEVEARLEPQALVLRVDAPKD